MAKGGQWLLTLAFLSVVLPSSCWERSVRMHLLSGTLPVSDGDQEVTHDAGCKPSKLQHSAHQ